MYKKTFESHWSKQHALMQQYALVWFYFVMVVHNNTNKKLAACLRPDVGGNFTMAHPHSFIMQFQDSTS